MPFQQETVADVPKHTAKRQLTTPGMHGSDNLALHRAAAGHIPAGPQRLDHIGFILDTPEAVDAWHQHLQTQGVPIKQPPRTHRDGARSFYCQDPDGNLVQMIYHPPIANR